MFCNDNVTPCVSGEILPAICGTCEVRFFQDCTDECLFTHCGDGVIQNPNYSGINEICDDGNMTAGDGCGVLCAVENCGDGYVDPNGPDNI